MAGNTLKALTKIRKLSSSGAISWVIRTHIKNDEKGELRL
jgi:hypothetical protein